MSDSRVAPDRGLAVSIVMLLVTLGGVVLSGWSARTIDPLNSGSLGLIEAMNLPFFVGLGMILVAFVITLCQERLNRPLLSLQLLAVIVLLYGLVSWREDVARLPTTWVHVGFIDYIQRTGEVLEDYDARFVWPGFFALGTIIVELGNTVDQSQIALWTPLVLNLAYAIPVWTIARSAGAPLRACWFATALFFLLNWVAQDYYSPQGINELLALCFLAVIMRVFFSHANLVPPWAKRSVEPWVRRRLPRLAERIEKLRLQAGGPARLAISGHQKAALVFLLVVLYAASVVSHQLTPFFLVLVVVAMVALDRLQIRVLPVIMVVGVFVWISYAATSFWAGQLGSLFGDIGNFSSVFDQNVENRITGDPDHQPVILLRLGVAAGLWLLAVFGLVRRIRKGRLDLLCIVGFAAPFLILGGQSYGGEAILRVYLYGLPFAATLVAMALSPTVDKWGWKTGSVGAVLLVALTPTFFLTRYGNEAFENFSSSEYAAVEQLYQAAPDGSKLLTVNTMLPWRGERIERLEYSALDDEFISGSSEEVMRQSMIMRAPDQESFLIITRAQDEYDQINRGQLPGFAFGIADRLVAAGELRVVYENEHAKIYEPADQA